MYVIQTKCLKRFRLNVYEFVRVFIHGVSLAVAVGHWRKLKQGARGVVGVALEHAHEGRGGHAQGKLGTCRAGHHAK